MTASQSNDTVLYPTDHMSQVASQIQTNANTNQTAHDTAWHDLQTYIQNNFAPEWQDTVTNLIKPYMDHLRASYSWQMDLSAAIQDAVNLIKKTDNGIAHQYSSEYQGFA